MQRFIPGIEGSQGITALALSQNRKFLAVCEKASTAICTVYSIGKLLESALEKRSVTIFDAKRRRVLCSNEDPAKEFVSVDFCSKNDRLLVTVSARGEPKAIIWNWDKQRIQYVADLAPAKNCTIDQVSFSSVDTGVVVVTGDDFYRYLKVDGQQLKTTHMAINKRESEQHFSTNYTCHAWFPDGKFVVCNDHGQIMLLDQNGEYKGVTISDPRKDPFPIMAITTFSGLGGMGAADSSGAGGQAAAPGKGAGAAAKSKAGAKAGAKAAAKSKGGKDAGAGASISDLRNAWP